MVRGKKVDCSVLVTGRGTDDGLIALREIEKGSVGFRESRQSVRGLWVNDDGQLLDPRDEESKSPSWLAAFLCVLNRPSTLIVSPNSSKCHQKTKVAETASSNLVED